jgi:MFS family permease
MHDPDNSPNRSKSVGGVRALGRALSHANYRLFFVGNGVSLIGTWMTRIATGWYVYQVCQPKDSLGDAASIGYAAAWLGLIGFAGQIPTFFLAPFAGALVDRWNRHRTLVATQLAAAVQSGLLAAVAFACEPGEAAIWLMLVLNVIQGVINSIDMPARQAFLVEMVTRREDLANAIALNSSLVNGARLVGPSVAGAILALTNAGWCFAIDAVSYLAVIGALLAMKLPPPGQRSVHPPIWNRVVAGFQYAFGFAPIRSILLLLAMVSFFGMPYSVLLPIFAGEILGGGPELLGILSGATGLGALVGALFLASRPSVLGLGRIIIIVTIVFGVGLVIFSFSTWLWLSLLAMTLTGFGMMVQMAASNTILQTIVDEDKRGRVMSFYSMAFLGMTPFGSLFAGYVAGWIGVQATVLVGGVACFLGAAVFAMRLQRLRALVRPIYARKGILTEVAVGMQTAAELTSPPRD